MFDNPEDIFVHAALEALEAHASGKSTADDVVALLKRITIQEGLVDSESPLWDEVIARTCWWWEE